MTKKTFYWNLKERKFNDLKAVNKEILNKSYVRGFLEEDKKIKLIDNFSNISDLFLRKENSKKYKIGSSIKTKSMVLKNIYWDKIQLVMPFLMSPKKKNLITKVKLNLLTKKKSKDKAYIDVLKKPVKGGFYVESFGINEFIPKTKHDFTKKPKNLKNETKLNKKTNISSNSKK